MNKFVVEQLQKCRVAKIPNFDDNTEEIIISKSQVDAESAQICMNTEYLIQISDDYISSEKYIAITNSWNNGQPLTHRYLKISITNFLDNMAKFDAVAYDYELQKDLNYVYLAYWVPIDCIKVIKKL